jgi:hypothetical protein
MLLDDGVGMDAVTLVTAMRPGSKSPLERRAPEDLGRFGLGLKTASFSQCRRLTVASKRNGRLSVRRWDLNHVVAVDDWQLLHGLDPRTSPELLNNLSALEHGTLVVWEDMDRVVGPEPAEDDRAEARFFRLCEEVERHLAMVFHLFIEGPHPSLRLYMNGRLEQSRLKPWDPFMRDHPATWNSPVETVAGPGGNIEIQGHVLPHQDRLTLERFREGAGPDGWLAQQGFYIYRNRRLVSVGGWLALGEPRAWTREEIYKLARIRVELTNASDSFWRIDIKKSAVRAPDEIRTRLRDLADRVRTRARHVFAYRGSPAPRAGPAGPVDRVWAGGEGRYRVDRTHPLVRATIESSDTPEIVDALLTAVEASVPVQRIWLDMTDAGITSVERPRKIAPPEVVLAAQALFQSFRTRSRLSSEDARQRIMRTEPFDLYPDLLDLLESPDVG